jgi:nitroimidazol reductase NimA-like FMN-containing flavoprotein (pyridoxamine 5'-phosphate oxidase superfamily)
MNRDYDEPMFIDLASCEKGCPEDQIEMEIRTLCLEQPFAVLATQGEGQPYTSLISFAVSDDLKHLAFSTPAQTRKYNLIIKNSKVSILVDNRSQQPESINLISGVTITGRARALTDTVEIDNWSRLLIEKHSYLQKFVKSPSSSLIVVDTVRFFYVRRFQEVYQWTPKGLS